MTSPATHSPSDVVLAAHGITKRFPGVLANDAVDLELRRGEVHCLLGENGAGKSTLMNVIFGLYQPDAGELAVEGEPVRFRSSADAIARGIGMVHQHFQLVQVFSVAENVVLGDELRRGPLLDLDAARERIATLSADWGVPVDPDAKVEDLSVGQQQRVELLKALFRDASILILDEPTAVLTPGEVDEFFGVVRSLTAEGKSIIFITHKLREVLAVADRITVLRQGKVVGSADPGEATPASLASLMVGREVLLSIEKEPAQPKDVTLRVRDLEVDDDRGIPAVTALSFDVRAGEIFGVAGVEGNGQRELVEAITGMRPKRGGRVELDGIDLTNANPRRVDEMGVGHVPEDRNKHGVVESFTIADNLVLNTYAAPSVRPALHPPDPRGRRAGHRAGQALRRAHAEHPRPGGDPVGRQPAEGDHRSRAVGRPPGAHRRPADAGPRRRVDRVHPPSHRRDARRGGRGAARVGRARRDLLPLRPHRRAVSAAAWSASSRAPRRRATPWDT